MDYIIFVNSYGAGREQAAENATSARSSHSGRGSRPAITGKSQRAAFQERSQHHRARLQLRGQEVAPESQAQGADLASTQKDKRPHEDHQGERAVERGHRRGPDPHEAGVAFWQKICPKGDDGGIPNDAVDAWRGGGVAGPSLQGLPHVVTNICI